MLQQLHADILAIFRVITIFQQYNMAGVPAMLQLLEYKINLLVYQSIHATKPFDLRLFLQDLKAHSVFKDYKFDMINYPYVVVQFQTYVPQKGAHWFEFVIHLEATESFLADNKTSLIKDAECPQSI